MALSLQTTGLLLLGLFMTTPSHSTDLRDYRWKQRVLLLSAPAAADPLYQEQIARLDAAPAGLQERDLVIVTEFGPDPFTLVLIGKDGGVKLKSAEPVTPDALFTLIDAMPMRRLERQSQRERDESDAPSANNPRAESNGRCNPESPHSSQSSSNRSSIISNARFADTG